MAVEVAVRMGEIAIGTDDDQLLALGLGSCVAVCLYDARASIAALAHVVLPESRGGSVEALGKYADTAVPEMLRLMQERGARRAFTRAAIAGGAHVFSFGGEKSPQMDIGARNVAAVRRELGAARVPVVAEDCGGSAGRTVVLEAGSGVVSVRTVGGQLSEVVRLGYSSDRAVKAA